MIPLHPFGSTGHNSTRTLFGAACLGKVDQATADRTLALMLSYGINHIDTAASYGDSELRIGPWMSQHRDDFFLATKTGDRTYEGARDSIRRSLERLQVDHVDLLQLHNLTDPVDWETAMGPGGALEAAIEARAQRLTRFIGVTGHGTIAPSIHRRSLERFPFDSVLLPYNFVMMQNPAYAGDFEVLVSLCQERGVAIQTIKGITAGPWNEKPRTRATWYEPLEDQADVDLAVHWVLGRPGFFLNTVGDVDVLPRVLDAASRFETRPSDDEMQSMVTREQMTPLFV
jgi:aryl-alcohol dehydrogenase-like predicted oxidoreductase